MKMYMDLFRIAYILFFFMSVRCRVALLMGEVAQMAGSLYQCHIKVSNHCKTNFLPKPLKILVLPGTVHAILRLRSTL